MMSFIAYGEAFHDAKTLAAPGCGIRRAWLWARICAERDAERNRAGSETPALDYDFIYIMMPSTRYATPRAILDGKDE